jgi:hypothetical protein
MERLTGSNAVPIRLLHGPIEIEGRTNRFATTRRPNTPEENQRHRRESE